MQSCQRISGCFKTSYPDQVPWGLGGEAEDRDEERRPQPLQRERDSVGPLIRAVNQPCEYPSSNELTDDEAHVGPTGEIYPEAHGQNFRCIRRS